MILAQRYGDPTKRTAWSLLRFAQQLNTPR
jgi:hypothetical protein